jgi:hypothetical protein
LEILSQTVLKACNASGLTNKFGMNVLLVLTPWLLTPLTSKLSVSLAPKTTNVRSLLLLVPHSLVWKLKLSEMATGLPRERICLSLHPLDGNHLKFRTVELSFSDLARLDGLPTTSQPSVQSAVLVSIALILPTSLSSALRDSLPLLRASTSV